MLADRLRVALDTGAVTLPEGDIAVFEPRPDDDLSDLPKDRVSVVTRQYPTSVAFAKLDYTVVDTAPAADMSIVVLPRAREAARLCIAQARATTTGALVIDGQKTDGVASVFKELKARAEVSPAVSKSHGKLFCVTGGDFSDWLMRRTTTLDGHFITAPGAFSADAIDPASQELANNLPPLKGTVLDLGTGWGFLGTAILSSPKVTALHLVEADKASLAAARQNIVDPRAEFHWADARTFALGTPVDTVVTNPPFHTGRATDPALGQAFIATAARLLSPKGDLWLVANRHLPYERALDAAFKTVRTLEPTPMFKLFHASSPRKG